MDLIDRDELREEVDRTINWNTNNEYNIYSDVMYMIDDAPAVNRWIPVEDALPEVGYSVLVTRQTESNTRYIKIASRQDDCWMDNTDKYGKPNPHPVIAWMPIPDAYEPPESEVNKDVQP